MPKNIYKVGVRIVTLVEAISQEDAIEQITSSDTDLRYYNALAVTDTLLIESAEEIQPLSVRLANTRISNHPLMYAKAMTRVQRYGFPSGTIGEIVDIKPIALGAEFFWLKIGRHQSAYKYIDNEINILDKPVQTDKDAAVGER